MFKRQYRFSAQTKLNHPNTFVSDSFLLKYTQNDTQLPRFSFIISKKLEKRAVKRNQMKRRFRARLEAIKSKINPGYDMLFILRQNNKNKTIKALNDEIQNGLLKSKLIKI